MADNETWTIGRLLAWTADYLRQRGAEQPRLDAEVMLAHVLDCQRIDLYAAFGQPADDETRAKFRELVKQRAAGKPVAYLVGRREFYALPFRVTPAVLIPRPETELIVVRLLDLARSASGVQHAWRVADVGTGSGVLAVCAAKHLPQANIFASDVSEAALAVARENALAHGVADRIEWRAGDLLSPWPAEARFDFILSNPPYVATAEMAELAVDVREYEPRQALEAGPRGTEVIERLIPQAAERLATGGWLLCEISPQLADEVSRLVAAQQRLEPGGVVKDSAGQARVVLARRR